MIRTSDIKKLSDFRQNATAHLDRLFQSGRIEVLTVNGEAKGIVMAPRVFEEITNRIEGLEIDAALSRGLADVVVGRTRQAGQAIDCLAAELGFSP